MTWLHTWTGLVVGWVLYFMFVTGTLAYFDTEIDRWMKPELPPANSAVDPLLVTNALLPVLQRDAAGAESWTIAFPVDRNRPYPQVFWNGADVDRGALSENGNIANIDLASGQSMATRDTGGGQKLYRMHYRLHYFPLLFGMWLAGICTMFMLLAIVTGIIIHKNIFKDFFTFKFKKHVRGWLDAHTVLSVMALPFHLMITYSGLIFLGSIYMPLIVSGFYEGGFEARRSYNQALNPSIDIPEAQGESALAADLAPMFEAANTRWGPGRVRYIEIFNPGDQQARIVFTENIDKSVFRHTEELLFDGVSGQLLRVEPPAQSLPKSASRLLISLHEGIFSDISLRWLYFMSGLLGTGMIASGLVLWAVKRRQKAQRQRKQSTSLKGLVLVEKLNVGTVVGLPIAIAAYFWANRLLPLTLENRADLEVNALFLVWLACLLHAALRPTNKVWKEQLLLAAVAYGGLPVLNALTTEKHLGYSLFRGDWVMAGFDLASLCTGLAFIFALARFRRFLRNQHSTPAPAASTAALLAEARA